MGTTSLRDGIEQARADSVIDSLAEQFWDKAKDEKLAPAPEAHVPEQHLRADGQAASDLDASEQAVNGRGPATAEGLRNPQGGQALSPNQPDKRPVASEQKRAGHQADASGVSAFGPSAQDSRNASSD